jgi:tetratricopeptide (TPR) repeat protein
MNKSKKSATPINKNKGKIKQETGNNSVFNWIGVIAIVILGMLIYANSFDCAFQFDDKHNIVDNEAIKSLTSVKQMWDINHSRFLAFYSFAINYHFGQLNVWGYHFVNMLIHLLNASLVFWIVRLLFKSPTLKEHSLAQHQSAIALITALLFVSHPLATGAVTYIVQRMASMVAMFYFLSIAFYLKGRLTSGTKSYMYFAGTALAALFAIHTKENAYTLPMAIVLFEVFFFSTKKIAINFADKKIIFSLIGIIAFIIITLSSFSFSVFNPIPPSTFNSTTITSSNYFFTQLIVIVKYIQLLIVPINQNLDYDLPIANSIMDGTSLVCGIFLLLLVGLAIYLYNKNRIVSFGIFWFFLTLSIESSIIPISDVIFEHRTYIPSFGYFLIITCLIYQMLYQKNKTLSTLLFVFLIGSNTILASQRNKVWKDEISLWSDANSKSPNKARPLINLGYAYGNLQQWDKAIVAFSKVNELEPNYHAAAYYNLGIAYWTTGQKEKSMENYSMAIKVDSTYADAYYGRGVCYYYLNDQDNALKDYSKALKYLQRPELYYNRALIYSYKKMWKEAIADFTRAISTTPDNPNLYYNRGLAYGSLNQWKLAADDFTKTLELDPQNKSAGSNREFAFSKMKESANKK